VDCPRIAEFHALITEMAFTHGYSLSHWQSSLQVLLEKKPGSIQIADLHALGLLEANFNASMKILVGHHMVQQALQADLIPPECYGSIPGCHAIQMSFSRCLLADISCQCHHPLAIACEDFACCYNQIAHCPVSLACQCLGVTQEIMSTIFFSLQFMMFYLCLLWWRALPTALPRCLSRQWGQSGYLTCTHPMSGTHDPQVWLPNRSPAQYHLQALQ